MTQQYDNLAESDHYKWVNWAYIHKSQNVPNFCTPLYNLCTFCKSLSFWVKSLRGHLSLRVQLGLIRISDQESGLEIMGE